MKLSMSKLPGQVIKQLLPTHVPAEQPAAGNVAPRASDADPASEAGRVAAPPAARQQSSQNIQSLGSRQKSEQKGDGASSSGMSQSGPYGSLLDKEAQRIAKFERILSAPIVDLVALRDASWSGIPAQFRMMAWQQLLGYLPANSEWRAATLQRKRREYSEAVPQYFDVDDSERSEYQRAILHQILIDVPRTCSSSALFQHKTVQRCLERILYIWALRHPASGYVQGINDLVLPFFLVFLSHALAHLPPSAAAAPAAEKAGGGVGLGATNSQAAWGAQVDLQALALGAEVDIDKVPPSVLADVEADSYWCLSKLLGVIQDHYTFAQPGIQRMVFRLKEIVQRIDRPLHAHLSSQGIQYIQFAFRWMNCLLMRELALPMITRVWDTYLAEGAADIDSPLSAVKGTPAVPTESFAVLHVYLCAALLLKWSDKLQQMQFQELVMFLQHLPTGHWGLSELEELLSQAYLWKELYHNSQAHLQSQAE